MRSFARVPRGDAAPANCIRCGRTEDLIDLGCEQIRGYGVVYFCVMCFSALAQGMELVEARTMQLRIEQEQQKSLYWKGLYDAAQIVLADAQAQPPLINHPPITNTDLEGLARELSAAIAHLTRLADADPRCGAGLPVPAVDAADAGVVPGPVGVVGEDAGDPAAPDRGKPGRGGSSAKRGVKKPAHPVQGAADRNADQPAGESGDDDSNRGPDGDSSDQWFAGLQPADE